MSGSDIAAIQSAENHGKEEKSVDVMAMLHPALSKPYPGVTDALGVGGALSAAGVLSAAFEGGVAAGGIFNQNATVHGGDLAEKTATLLTGEALNQPQSESGETTPDDYEVDKTEVVPEALENEAYPHADQAIDTAGGADWKESDVMHQDERVVDNLRSPDYSPGMQDLENGMSVGG